MVELSQNVNTIFSLLFVAAVMHSFFLAALLLAKSSKEKGLTWLGLMMIPTSLLLLTYLLYLGNAMRENPHLLGVFGPMIYTIGALYYFFIRQSVNSNERFKWYDLLHLVPILYVTWEYLPLYQMSSDAKLAMIEQLHQPQRPSFLKLLQANRLTFLILAYITTSLLFLRSQGRKQKEKMDRIRWLTVFSKIFALVFFLKLLIMSSVWAFDLPGVALELIMVLVMAAAIHLLGYVVLGKEHILPKLIQPNENGKYAKSRLSQAQIDAFKQEILQYLDTERPWIDTEFSINDLANELNLSRHNISQALNIGIQKSFYDLICQYRVEEVKERLQSGDTSRYSILGIATDSGFRSKSSFHRAFKKETGMTPTDYLKQRISSD